MVTPTAGTKMKRLLFTMLVGEFKFRRSNLTLTPSQQLGELHQCQSLYSQTIAMPLVVRSLCKEGRFTFILYSITNYIVACHIIFLDYLEVGDICNWSTLSLAYSGLYSFVLSCWLYYITVIGCIFYLSFRTLFQYQLHPLFTVFPGKAIWQWCST